MGTLKDSFQSRQSWVNYRSSTIYPIFCGLDSFLVFQNYWEWKSKISISKLRLTYRTECGQTVQVSEIEEIRVNNVIPLIVKGNDVTSVEVEIISKENIRFPFPATLLLVKNESGELASTVHSGGRILNEDEPHNRISAEESNFLCRLDEGFTPFFHIFNGREVFSSNDSHYKLRVDLHEVEHGELIETIEVMLSSLPFAFYFCLIEPVTTVCLHQLITLGHPFKSLFRALIETAEQRQPMVRIAQVVQPW